MESKEDYVLRKCQNVLDSMAAWYDLWNINIIEEKTQVTHCSHSIRPSESLTMNGQNIPFINSVKYLGVVVDKKLA
jgi:hypothetical protein